MVRALRMGAGEPLRGPPAVHRKPWATDASHRTETQFLEHKAMRTLSLDITVLRVESFDVEPLPQATSLVGLPTLVTRMAACCDPTIRAQENQ